MTPISTPSLRSSPLLTLAARPGPELWNGLVAYYPFDGDMNDHASNIDLTMPALTFSNGVFGDSAEFHTSSTATSSLTATLPSSNAPRTFSVWVKASALGDGPIFYWGGGLFGMSGLFNGAEEYRADGNYAAFGSSRALPLNTWAHVTITYDGSVLSIFENATLVATGPPREGDNIRQWNTQSPTRVIIGDSSFSGALDDLRIYNRVLTPTEIASLLVPGSPSASPSPSTSPYCAPSLFRSLPRMDLVGSLVGTALSPGAPVPLPSMSSCRQACCDAPACDGYAFASGDMSFISGGSAGCFLYVNITQLIPSSVMSSGIYESTL